MYDGFVVGRNDDCWCGSGKKYKKCHLDFDEKLQMLAEAGEMVPPRYLLKTPEQIARIKESAAINVGALDYVSDRIRAGVSTDDINEWVHTFTLEHGAIPAPLNYEGFPKSVCTSVNEVVCHGIPSDTEILQSGDIINVDCSTILNGYFSDSSRMFCIGDVDPAAQKLVDVTKESIQIGLQYVKPWGHLDDIGAAIHDFATQNGYTVVREFGGHGIGLEFHEDPHVNFCTKAGEGWILVPGLMFTIEPMINMGKQAIDMRDPNGWTVRTKDRQPSAQWEVQVVVTDTGYELISW